MNISFYKALRLWIPLAIIVTLLCGLIYWAVQQNYRLSANDPQIQISEDGANYLKAGGAVNLTSTNKVEISQSLLPFVMIYDQNKKLISYTGVLHGQPTQIPTGVLDNAKKLGENRVTWQPSTDSRNAIVVTYYKGTKEGYVAVGRSLKEVEKREDLLTKGIFAGWAITILLTLFSVLLLESRLNLKLRK